MGLAAHSKRVRSYWDGYKPNGGNECLGKNPFCLWPRKKKKQEPTANLRLQGWARKIVSNLVDRVLMQYKNLLSGFCFSSW
jgi:hypothetical protein